MESEQGVLSCVLQEPMASLGRCVERKMTAAWCYDLRHQAIFNALRTMYDAGTGIDLITVQAELKARGVLAEIGGVAYLGELQDVAPSAANLEAYLARVRDLFRVRRLIQICAGTVGKAYEYQGEAEKLLLAAAAEVDGLTEEETDAGEVHIKAVMNQVVNDMESWHYSRGSTQLRGLATGPAGNYLDKVLTGIRETHFVTVAARPGGGKSALALNIVEYLAEHHVWYEPVLNADGSPVYDTTETGEQVPKTIKRTGMPIAVFSIEMDNESLGYRLLFGRAGVSEAKFNQGFAEKGDAERLVSAAHQLGKLNIYLDDTPAQTIGQIAAKARRMAKQYGIKLFVLDYLQLAESDDPRDETRVKVNKISKKIMALKKQLKVPWLVLAQLNRNIETAERDRNPLLSDLAESGAIEQDSDKVIILKNTGRRELELEKPGQDGHAISDAEMLDRICADWEWSKRPRRVDAWVVKNRRGPTGKAEFVFQGNLCRFTDWHLFKVLHGVEARREGESKHMAQPPATETQDDFVGPEATTDEHG